MANILFSEMELSPEIKRAVEDLGFEEATSIQAQSIPLILSGRDVIGHSQTGTGKTAAFSIPAIEKIDPSMGWKTQVLILCPTRELAVQACDEIQKFSKYKSRIRTVPVYGGQPIERQLRALQQGAQIVVGTPGRVMDHLRRHTLKLGNLKMVILDEADEMLSMGFREDIETILQDIPEERQTLLFSATMSPEIMRLTGQYQKNPELIKVAHTQMTVPSIEQFYYEVPMGKKVEVLSRLLDIYNPKRSMVFCNTKKQVDELVSALQLRGYLTEGLHGDMKQQTRTHVMDMFKSGNIDVLVATDVAARGIDVDDIGAVFNYDIPQDVEYYVHRIGRTGRAGKDGRAFTFVSGRRQVYELRDIMNFTKAKIELRAVPSSAEVLETKSNQFLQKVKKAVQEGGLEDYIKILDQLLEEDCTSVDVAAALIKMCLNKDGGDLAAARADDAIFMAESRRMASSRIRGDYFSGKNGNGKRAPYPSSRRPAASRERFSRDDDTMANVIISIGRDQRVSANHILGALAGETGLPGKAFGRIEIQDSYTVVGVPKEHLNRVVEAMQGTKIMGRKTVTKPVESRRIK